MCKSLCPPEQKTSETLKISLFYSKGPGAVMKHQRFLGQMDQFCNNRAFPTKGSRSSICAQSTFSKICITFLGRQSIYFTARYLQHGILVISLQSDIIGLTSSPTKPQPSAWELSLPVLWQISPCLLLFRFPLCCCKTKRKGTICLACN